jgi:uncharacterized integral membrane protein
MKKVKIVAIVVISVLALVVSLQNTAAVETKLLFMSVTMPRVVLLVAVFLIGFVTGILTMGYLSREPRKPAEATYGKSQTP